MNKETRDLLSEKMRIKHYPKKKYSVLPLWVKYLKKISPALIGLSFLTIFPYLSLSVNFSPPLLLPNSDDNLINKLNISIVAGCVAAIGIIGLSIETDSDN